MTENMKHNIPNYIKIIFELCKVRISLPIALSALTGYVLMAGRIGSDGWLLTLGVFLMSCSSSALNHFQEYKTDALMPRTKNRPIPSGRITPGFAFLIAALFFILGAFVLLQNFPIIAFGISVATLISYNLIYTPLKKVTAFAVVPGSLVGALPPYIGWLAANGSIQDTRIFWVALFFFIGQIPHFWLLLLMFGNDYQVAGYPSLNQLFSEQQIKRLSFTWILATIASALIIALKILQGHTASFILLFYIFYLLFSLSISLLLKKKLEAKPAFYKLNILYLFMMVFLIVDSILHH